MKKFIPITAFLLLSVFLSAQDKLILAVPNIEGKNVPEHIVSTCRNMVEAAIIQTEVFQVLSYNDVEQILEAQAFSLSGCTDESCAIEIGELLAAENIIVGELTGLTEEKMFLALRLIDVTTGKSIKAEIANIDSYEDMQKQIFTASYKLVGLKYVEGSEQAISETGSLYISAPEGWILDIYIDGELKGKTPLLVEEIPFGVHLLEGKAEGYHYKKEISINTKDVDEVVADISQLTGNVLLTVVPSSASGLNVTIGEQEGRVGLNKDVQAGEQPVHIEGNGWLYDGTVSIEDAKTTQTTLELAPVGKLAVSFPEGGTAEVSDKSGGLYVLENETPIQLHTGDWNLSVQHPDYEEYNSTVTVKHGEVTVLQPELLHTELYLNKERLVQLQDERENILQRRKKFNIGMFTSFGVAIVSAGLTAVFEGLIAQQNTELLENYTAYEDETISAEAQAIWGDIETNLANIGNYETLSLASLIGAGVGGIAGGVFFFLRPSLSEIDLQIETINMKIRVEE